MGLAPRSAPWWPSSDDRLIAAGRRSLTTGVTLLLVLLAVLLGLNLWRDYGRSVELTTVTCQNLARLLAQQIAATSRNVDITLLSLSKALRHRGGDIDELVAYHHQMLPESISILVFNQQGELIAGGPPGQHISVQDRDYFVALRDGSGDGLVVGAPVVGRLSNVWLLPFARRVDDADSRFSGIVLAGVELHHFDVLFRSIQLGTNGVIALRDAQLRLIQRYPEPQSFGVNVGQQPTQEVVWQLWQEGREEQIFGAASSVDQIERVFVMRRIGEYPFTLFVGQSITDGLREWRLTGWISLGIFVFVATVTLSFTLLINRSWRQQEEALLEAREAQQRYRSVIAAMSEGVVVENANGRVIAHNPAAATMLGDPDPSSGCLDWENPYWRVLNDAGQPFAREYLPWRLCFASGLPQDAVIIGVERPDQPLCWLSVNVRAILAPGERAVHAVVTTLTDITQRRETDNELRLAASVYRASGEAIMVVDSEQRVLSVNPAFTRITGFDGAALLGKIPACLDARPTTGGPSFLDCLAQDSALQVEVWCRHHDGASFPVWASVDVLADEHGGARRKVIMFADISERKRAEQTIWRQANYDPLTGLVNRNLFAGRLQQEIERARQSGKRVALLFVDLDRFKEVNDTLGHHYGDLLLKEVASRLRDCIRRSDTASRFGGDEFAVLLPRLVTSEQATLIATKLLQSLCQPFALDIDATHLSASVGIAVFPDDGDDVETLFRHADQALYSAKDGGRNAFAYFTPAMQEAVRERQQMHNDLHGALRRNEFAVHVQPVVSLPDSRVVKAEALLRWWHTGRQEFVNPALFVPLAEDFGLIGEIGEFVFRTAVQAARGWIDGSLGRLQIGINVSARQFAGERMPTDWINWLRDIDMPRELVALEITESLLLDERREPHQKLASCRDAGLQIAIDDFGTGYSSLAYLKRLAVDLLKIDQSFIRDLEHDPTDRALVEAIIIMAHKLGLAVIAEGVETQAQRDFLVQAHCDFAQGYYFARPMPLEAFAESLRAAGGHWVLAGSDPDAAAS